MKMLYRIWAQDGKAEIIEANNIKDAKRIFAEKIGRRPMVIIGLDKNADNA